MTRLTVCLFAALILAACGNEDRNPNSVIVTDNSGNAMTDNNDNNTTSSSNNGTNGTTATNNNTTMSTNNATNNNTTMSTNSSTNNMVSLALEGSIVAGDMPPQLPIACAVRLYDPNDINPSDADLFATPLQQEAFTLREFPMPWVFEGLNRNDRYYVGVLCDRDDDQQFDNIGGFHLDSQDVPTTVVVPATGVNIRVGTFSL